METKSTPYRVWISEMMLQQTRVETVVPYFTRFMKRFPCVQDLANAETEEVLRHWEGLGYYSRARNLHRAARIITDQWQGELPDTVETIQTLPGIGPYSSGAIISLAFNKPAVAIDGNVIRVLSRFFAQKIDKQNTHDRQQVEAWVHALQSKKEPGAFNEALMELGATVCKPKNPLCNTCPWNQQCKAFQKNDQEQYPGIKKKTKIRIEHRALALLHHRKKWLLQENPPKGLLGGMWEFPNFTIEIVEKKAKPLDIQKKMRRLLHQDIDIRDSLPSFIHRFSHIEMHYHPFVCRIRRQKKSKKPYVWVLENDFETKPLPKTQRNLANRFVRKP